MSGLLRNNIIPELNLFFAPAEAGAADGKTELSKDDIFKALNTDDDEPEKIDLEDKEDKDDKKDDREDKEDKKDDKEDEEKEDEEKEDEEDDELKDLEEELEEPDEEKLELTPPVRRREILKKYPDLFKDFPYLERAYYREQQYTEYFPTIDDAKEAVDKASTLDKFESDLSNGIIEPALRAVKTNEKAFAKLADNYLAVLQKVDEPAYLNVVGNILKHTIARMATESKSSSNEALMDAAKTLNQFIFATAEYVPPTNLSKADSKDDTKEQELAEKERAFNRRRFDDANNGVSSRVNNAYKATIEANIDPKGSMTEYVKKNASREALENLESLIGKDTRFKQLVDRLWERAIQEDYSKPAMDAIKSAFTSKAKTLLPSVLKKARTDALRGMGKRVRNTDEEDSKNPTKETKPQSSKSSGQTKDSKDIRPGESSLDYLMRD